MSKWIRFERVNLTDRRTGVWDVLEKTGDGYLGSVRWYAPWRKYCFMPNGQTVFEQVCLRDIADFCENSTKEHKAELTKRGGNENGSQNQV